MFCNRRHLPPGLDRSRRGTASPWTGDGDAGLRRRRLGALRHQTDWTQARDLRAATPRSSLELQRALPDRGDEVQRAAPRRPGGGAASAGPRRAAELVQGRLAAALRRHGPPLGALRRRHQEQVTRDHGRDRGPRGRRRGRDPRARAAHRRLSALR